MVEFREALNSVPIDVELIILFFHGLKGNQRLIDVNIVEMIEVIIFSDSN